PAYPNGFPRSRRLDKLTVSQIHAYMIGNLTAVDMEKQQISPAQVVVRHNRCPAIVVHLIGRTRELRLEDLVVGIKNQPATVEALIRPRAAPDVRLAKLLLQTVNRYFGDVMQMVAA